MLKVSPSYQLEENAYWFDLPKVYLSCSPSQRLVTFALCLRVGKHYKWEQRSLQISGISWAREEMSSAYLSDHILNPSLPLCLSQLSVSSMEGKTSYSWALKTCQCRGWIILLIAVIILNKVSFLFFCLFVPISFWNIYMSVFSVNDLFLFGILQSIDRLYFMFHGSLFSFIFISSISISFLYLSYFPSSCLPAYQHT